MKNYNLTNAIQKWKQLRIERIHNYNLHPKLCKNCNLPIPYDKHKENIFCNSSCAASYNNKITKLKKITTCKICGKQIHFRNTFCSQSCINKSREPKIIENYKEKIKHNTIVHKSSIRTYMLLTREYKCNRCGITKWQGESISLECHHKDGISSHNNDDNLEWLCPNCHSLTNNYRGRNNN